VLFPLLPYALVGFKPVSSVPEADEMTTTYATPFGSKFTYILQTIYAKLEITFSIIFFVKI
jgi:hypothetical protein